MECYKHKLRKRQGCILCYPPTQEVIDNIDLTGTGISEEFLVEVTQDPFNQNDIPADIPSFEVPKKDLPAPVGIKTKDLLKMSMAQSAIVQTEVVDSAGHYRFDEKEYIKDLIDKTIKDMSSKIKNELQDLKSISWEHLDIPVGMFSIALMYALGEEGWVYKDTFRGEIAKISGLREEAVIMTRVKSDKWPPVPDFTKRNTLKKYLEKEL